MSRPALHLAAADAGPGTARRAPAGWNGCAARLDPGWRPGEWDGRLLLFTGDLDSAADRGVAVPDPGLPDGDAPPRRPLRRLPPRPVDRRRLLGGVRRRAAAARYPPAAREGPARWPAARASCTAAGLCFRHERAWRKAGAGPVAAFIARARPLTAGRGLPGRWLRPRERHPPRAVPFPRPCGCAAGTMSLAVRRRAGRLDRRRAAPARGAPVLPGRACPSCCGASCSTRCSAATRRRRRWTPARCGSCSARLGTPPRCATPTPRRSARAAACNTTRRPGACSATCAGTWNGPGPSTPAPTRSPATCGRWRCWTCRSTPPGAGRPPRA